MSDRGHVQTICDVSVPSRLLHYSICVYINTARIAARNTIIKRKDFNLMFTSGYWFYDSFWLKRHIPTALFVYVDERGRNLWDALRSQLIRHIENIELHKYIHALKEAATDFDEVSGLATYGCRLDIVYDIVEVYI